jgi:hypothetical protein
MVKGKAKKKAAVEVVDDAPKQETPCTLCKKNRTLGVHNAPDGSKMMVCFDCHKAIHRK